MTLLTQCHVLDQLVLPLLPSPRIYTPLPALALIALTLSFPSFHFLSFLSPFSHAQVHYLLKSFPGRTSFLTFWDTSCGTFPVLCAIYLLKTFPLGAHILTEVQTLKEETHLTVLHTRSPWSQEHSAWVVPTVQGRRSCLSVARWGRSDVLYLYTCTTPNLVVKEFILDLPMLNNV